MKEYIKNEIRRTIISKNALIAFIITVFSLILAFLEFVQFPKISINDINKIYDAVDIFIRIRCTARASTLVLIAPLLAALVFSDSYLLDKESGFLKFIYLRIDQKKYIWTKILVNALVSGIVISLASLIVLCFLSSIYGVRATSLHQIEGPFSWIYYKSRFIYALFLIVISFIFNVIFSTLALGISPWIKNRYLTFVFPFFYYIMSATIFEMLGLCKYFSINGIILFDLNPVATEFNIIAYQCILLVIGIMLFYFGVHKDEKNI